MIIDNHHINGADISKYQGYPPLFPVVNFKRMRNSGMEFVVLKATQKDYMDPSFRYNVKEAVQWLPTSFYHYYDNGKDPRSQAAFFWDVVEEFYTGGILWADIEHMGPGNYYGWNHWYNFMYELQRRSGLPDDRLGIYTGFYYWKDGVASALPAQLEYFHRFWLWEAWYHPNPFKPLFQQVLVPRPWAEDEVLMLQSGTPVIGLASGVYSFEIDYNFFNGPYELFYKLFPFNGQKSNINVKIRRF